MKDVDSANEKGYIDTEQEATGQRIITDMHLVMGCRNKHIHIDTHSEANNPYPSPPFIQTLLSSPLR